jgi:hypothetical protein
MSWKHKTSLLVVWGLGGGCDYKGAALVSFGGNGIVLGLDFVMGT